MGLVGQLNSCPARRPADLAGYRYGNGAVSLVVYGDPMHQEQTGSGRPGAKGLLHLVAGLRANENPTVLRVRPGVVWRISVNEDVHYLPWRFDFKRSTTMVLPGLRRGHRSSLMIP